MNWRKAKRSLNPNLHHNSHSKRCRQPNLKTASSIFEDALFSQCLARWFHTGIFLRQPCAIHAIRICFRSLDVRGPRQLISLLGVNRRVDAYGVCVRRIHGHDALVPSFPSRNALLVRSSGTVGTSRFHFRLPARHADREHQDDTAHDPAVRDMHGRLSGCVADRGCAGQQPSGSSDAFSYEVYWEHGEIDFPGCSYAHGCQRSGRSLCIWRRLCRGVGL